MLSSGGSDFIRESELVHFTRQSNRVGAVNDATRMQHSYRVAEPYLAVECILMGILRSRRYRNLTEYVIDKIGRYSWP